MVFGFGGSNAEGTYKAVGAKGQEMEIPNTYALQGLGKTSGAYLKQRMSKCEMLTCNCWESKNKYDVYVNGRITYYAHETTPCCMRQLQKGCPDCAAWDVEIDYLGSDGKQEGAFKMTKACTPCTFLCINRPVTYVYDYDGNLLGGIKDPCAIIPTNMTFDIQDENGDAMFTAESGCCQWGICCPFPCGPCKKVEFPIKDKNGSSKGHLTKSMKGCFKTFCLSICFDDAENYKVDWSGVEDLRSRALLMALAVFTDMRYFNNNDEEEVKPEE